MFPKIKARYIRIMSSVPFLKTVTARADFGFPQPCRKEHMQKLAAHIGNEGLSSFRNFAPYSAVLSFPINNQTMFFA